MNDLHMTDMSEEQLRIDLEQAQKSEQSHKNRANELEAMVEKLEAMIKEMDEKMQSSNKEQDKYEVEDLLERQNEKLEDKLTAAREELVLERQSARTANLNAWKLEKQLEELRAEQKVAQRRLELMEHRLKSTAAEHDNTKLKHKQTLLELKLRDERIHNLEEELNQLKQDIQRERQKWTKCEEELMLNKSKVVQQFAKIRTLETNVNEAKQHVNQLQSKYDESAQEYKRVIFELKDEQLLKKAQAKEINDLQAQLRKMQRNYHQLKEACHITDTQLTEVEVLLHKNQTRVTELEASTAKLEHLVRNRNETISELNMKSANYEENIKELRNKLERANKLLIEREQSQQQLSEQLNSAKSQHDMLHRTYLKSLHDLDVLKQGAEQLQRMTENRSKELQTLKDENSQLLTQLFYAKEKVENLQSELETLQVNMSAQRADIEELHNVLTEKEQFYLQRNIRTETILSQQKKLIDYLQIKVDDLTNQNKRKKTLVDRIFGVSHAPDHSSVGGGGSSSNNVPAHVIEAHILHRTLQKELQREKQLVEELQQKIEGLHLQEPPVLAPKQKDVLNEHTASNVQEKTRHEHQFEKMMNYVKKQKCLVCKSNLYLRQQCWSCKECHQRVHKKCYEAGKENVCMQKSKEEQLVEAKAPEPTSAQVGIVDIEPNEADNFLRNVFNMNMVSHMQLKPNLVIYCAHEIEEQKLLLLGTDCGLFALHVDSNPSILTRIKLGMETDIRNMAVAKRLAKILFVTSRGVSLSQCDYRQLESRCRSNDTQNALESIVLDLNLSNRSNSELWENIFISSEHSNPIDTMVIAVTAQRIVLLKYDESQQFLPVRAMNTETKVTYVLFTPFSALLASDHFYEIDLETYSTEPFLQTNTTDKGFQECHPMFMVKLSQHEYLLCFIELGIFVDEFGGRSRPGCLHWQFTPTEFFYNAPYLYISHFHSVQIMRLTKSFSQNLLKQPSDDGMQEIPLDEFTMRPIIIYFHKPRTMPIVLAESGRHRVYVVSTNELTNEPYIALLDGRNSCKTTSHVCASLDSLTSITTSLTSGSTITTTTINTITNTLEEDKN